jgi:transcriptional antiterminator RfaH
MMTTEPTDPNSSDRSSQPAWFCLKTPPKKESVAAAHVGRLDFVDDVFSPFIRYKKNSRRGRIWFCEALFPGYLFGRFSYEQGGRAVRYANGVSGIVHFGDVIPRIEDQVIEDLRSNCSAAGAKEILEIDSSLQEGDEVTITAGAFRGLTAVVRQLKSGRERIRLLLEFMNTRIEAEVSHSQIVANRAPRERSSIQLC